MSDEPTPDAQAPTAAPASDEAGTEAPRPRSIARDVALVAVVFVAVFILLAGLLWLAVPSGERGATRAAPISTLRSMADPTPVVTAL